MSPPVAARKERDGESGGGGLGPTGTRATVEREGGRYRSGGGVSGVPSLTWSVSLPIYGPFCVPVSVALCLFLCLLIAHNPESPSRFLSRSLSVSFRGPLASLSPRFVRGVAVPVSAASASSCPHPAPCTCLHLPRPRRNFAPFSGSRRGRRAPAGPRRSVGAGVPRSRPATGRRRRRELALPGPRLPVGWVRRGIRSGEHWLHKGRERAGQGGPSSARAGLCNG